MAWRDGRRVGLGHTERGARMKIHCQVRVGSVTHGEGARVRVQAGEPTLRLDGAQIYFSWPAAEAPTPGQVVTVTIEWEAPA